MLLSHLSGLAPLKKTIKDKRGWGLSSGKYTAAEGYQNFSANYNVPRNPEIWNYIWNCRTIPKIEMFSWTLMHGRVLTGENLEKRGIVGPFCCPLCAVNAENISHLFLKCPFATSVWKEVLKHWGGELKLLYHIQSCFLNWDKLYQGELGKKNGLKAC